MTKHVGFLNRLVRISVLASVLVLSVACDRLADGLTCDGVRKLKIGMTPAEVRNILGPPLSSASGGSMCGKTTIRECWFYSTSNRVSVNFDAVGLVRASAYYKPIFGDRSVTIFSLDPDVPKMYEGDEFVRYLKCSS